jgi:hypothetical protein
MILSSSNYMLPYLVIPSCFRLYHPLPDDTLLLQMISSTSSWYSPPSDDTLHSKMIPTPSENALLLQMILASWYFPPINYTLPFPPIFATAACPST